MTAQELRHLVDQLADLHSALDLVNLSMNEARKQAVPPEVQKALDEIEDEYAPKLEEVRARIAEMETQVKAAVVEHGATVKGQRMQAVFSAGRVSWDTKALDGYAMNVPELFAFRKEGQPSVSIRWIK